MMLLGMEIGVQLGFDVTDELQQSLHRFVLVHLHAAIYVVNLLTSRLLNLGLHVTARAQDLSTNNSHKLECWLMPQTAHITGKNNQLFTINSYRMPSRLVPAR